MEADRQLSSAGLMKEITEEFGLKVDGVEIQHSERGYRLVATKDIPENFGFASVPFHSIVNMSNIRRICAPLAEVMEANKGIIEREDDQLAIVMYLIYCRIHAIHKEWLKIESWTFVDFDAALIRQTGDEELLMEFQAATVAQDKQFAEVWSIIECYHKVFGKVTKEQCKMFHSWACSFLHTRAFGYGMKESALIPFFDCLNHTYDQTQQIVQFLLVDQQIENKSAQQSPASCQEQYTVSYRRIKGNVDIGILGLDRLTTKPQEPGEVEKESTSDNDSEKEQEVQPNLKYPDYSHIVLATTKACPAGSELFLHYGCRNNSYLLRWYGFCISHNPYDSLQVWLSHSSEAVYFDAIERPSTMFKLKWKSICLPMINWGRKHYYEQHYRHQPKGLVLWTVPKKLDYELFIIDRLLDRLQRHRLQPKTVQGQQHYVEYLNLYQRERCRMLQTQIQYFQDLLNWLRLYQQTRLAGSFTTSLEPYCRSFIVAFSV